MAAPTDAESVAMYKAPDEVAAQINNYIHTHPLAVSLRSDPAWKESRPHLRYPENYKKHSLTAGTLLGPGRIPVPPLVFSDGKSLLSMSYLGTDLCGHVGIVHGGMLATMLDEGLARCAFESLPNKIGVTATLTVKYKKPVPAGSFLVLRSETTKVEGRKVWVTGSIEILGEDEKLSGPLVEAEGLFIEPKYAKVGLDEVPSKFGHVADYYRLYHGCSLMSRSQRVLHDIDQRPVFCSILGLIRYRRKSHRR